MRGSADTSLVVVMRDDGGRDYLMDVLAMLFGISSWISINGLWVELPVIVTTAPESWALASYLSLIVQMANLGPIGYGLLRWKTRDGVNKAVTIYFVLIVGVVASLALVFFWDDTAQVLGSRRSVGLFVCVFLLSLVDCTSSVLFMPFMTHFRSIYLNSYLIGEGLSGWIPALVSLVQGVGGNPVCVNVTVVDPETGSTVVKEEPVTPDPRFSVSLFFLMLFAMMLTSLLAFVLLNNLKRFQAQKLANSPNDTPTATNDTPTQLASYGSLQHNSQDSIEMDGGSTSSILSSPSFLAQRRKMYVLLAMHTFLCFVSNGFFPSIMTYSCLPFGNVVYHLATALHALANPSMAFVAIFYPSSSLRKSLAPLTLIGALLTLFIVATALHSPQPLLGLQLGGTLTVIVWVLYGSVFSYVKVCIFMWCRGFAVSALFWCGVFTQLGSALGALLAYLLVNQFHIFQQYYVTCPQQ